MNQALYRKWRPLVFDDIIGQNHIKNILKSQIQNNKIGHAYLFSGTRGTGKTSAAKIFARAVNCENINDGNPCNKCTICLSILNNSNLDIVEIDAASNNGVDNIRELRDEIKYLPASSRFKVYIIDEVHMLSQSAFNALLKTLEEPPGHIIFILATTDVHKVPKTILSRCQKFLFRNISTGDILLRLKYIIASENFKFDENALSFIARSGEGSMRDALSILDLCVNESDAVTLENVTEILGYQSYQKFYDITEFIINHDTDSLMTYLSDVYDEGRSLNLFVENTLEYFHNLLVSKKITNHSKYFKNLIPEEIENLKLQAEKLSSEQIAVSIEILKDTLDNIKYFQNKSALIDVAFIKIINSFLITTEQKFIVDKITLLESKLESLNVFSKSNEPLNTIQKDNYSPKIAETQTDNNISAAPNSVGDLKPAPEEKISSQGVSWKTIRKELEAKKTFFINFIKDDKVYINQNKLIITLGNEILKSKIDTPENKLLLKKTIYDIYNIDMVILVELIDNKENNILKFVEHIKNNERLSMISEIIN